MTDRVFPSNARDITETLLGNIVRYAGGSDPGWVVPSGEVALADSARNGFDSSTGSDFDVTIDTGEAFVHGIWVDRSLTTTVTLAASTSEQTVYVGVDTSQKNTIIIGLDEDFSADDPKMAIWTYDTDGSGVTSETDERYTKPTIQAYKGNDLDTDGDGKVDEAESAETADKIEGQLIGKERMQFSGNIGGGLENSYSLDFEDTKIVQKITINIADDKKLVLKQIRFLFHNSTRFLVESDPSSNTYESPAETVYDAEPGTVLYSNTSGSSVDVEITLKRENSAGSPSVTIKSYDGWWVDLSVEEI